MSTTLPRAKSPASPRPSATVARRERLSGAVQAVGRRPVDVERRRGESLTVFAVFAALYAALGYWLVVEQHVVGFETLDRWTRALMVVRNEPAGLAAVGPDHPPLSVLLLAPFAVVSRLTDPLALVPVVPAVFAAATMVVLHTMMRRARVALPLRLALLAGVGLNPLVVMYAATGARDFLWLALVVAALGALFAWYVTADIRFVMVAGLAYAVAALTGYGSLVWFGVSLVMVAAILARLGADGLEVEGTTVGLATPTVYVLALWSALNLVLLGSPFGWLTGVRGTADATAGLSFVDVVRGTAELVVHGAPIGIVVLPALVVAGVARHNGFALWLGLVLLVTILLPGVLALLRVTDSPMVMRDALPILLVSVVGALWLARSAVGPATVVAGLLAVGLGLSIPWTFASMDDFERQDLERAFHDAVRTGESQAGVRTLDGSYVGTNHEREMADQVLDEVDDADSVLTDEASTYAVVLMTGRPDLFVDRVDGSDDSWLRTARAPAGRVTHLLMSSAPASGDLLTGLYPAAALGDDPALGEVFRNDRYVLVEVPADYRFGDTLPHDVDVDVDGDGVPALDQPPTPDDDVDGAGLGGYDGVIGEPGTEVLPDRAGKDAP